MLKPINTAIIALAAALSTSTAFAVDLPSGTVDRAVVCFVYGGFAPPSDPRSATAKAAIDQTIESAVASGATTREQVKAQIYDTIALVMDEEPRAELIANWNECRDSFAP